MVRLDPQSRLGREVGEMALYEPSPVYPMGKEPLWKDWNAETRKRYGVPSYIRLEIPMESQASLRRTADYLRGLATKLEIIGERTGISETEAMINAKTEIRVTNQRIKETTKSGY